MPTLERPDGASVVAHDEGPSTSLLGRLKNQVVRQGPCSRRIRGGALKGLWMHLDLRHQSQIYLGLYEREVHGWLRALGRGAKTAVDAGAADGAYSLYFLKHTNARAVFAFEPDSAARELFRANLQLNGVESDHRVHVFDVPVGTGLSANTVALDSLSGRMELPCVIKVDVEGHETDVLDGAAALLRGGGSSWIIETHSAELERACIERLERHGLVVAIVSPAWWRRAIPETRPIAHNRWLVAHPKGLSLQ